MCLVGDRGIYSSGGPLLSMVRLVPEEMAVRMLVKCISEKKRQKSNFLLYLAMYKMEFKWSIGTPGPLERLDPEEMKVMSISSCTLRFVIPCCSVGYSRLAV